jgi:hypothetical protein
MLIALLGVVVVGLGLLSVVLVVSLVCVSIVVDSTVVPESELALSLGSGIGVLLFVIASVVELHRADSFVAREFDARDQPRRSVPDSRLGFIDSLTSTTSQRQLSGSRTPKLPTLQCRDSLDDARHWSSRPVCSRRSPMRNSRQFSLTNSRMW